MFSFPFPGKLTYSHFGITTYVYVLPNKHPRRITDIPGLIAFKSPGKGIAAFLPQKVPDEIFDGLFRAMIVTKGDKGFAPDLLKAFGIETAVS